MAETPRPVEQPKKTERKLYGLKHAAAIAAPIVGGIALMLVLRGCEPKHEPPIQCKPVPTAVDGDGTCDQELGEANPKSKTFSVKDCGFCGDNIAQPWETPADCAVDFHCGNGKKEIMVAYGGLIEGKDEKGKTIYAYEVLSVNECEPTSRTYCETDCPKEVAKVSGGHRKPREPKEPSEPDQGCVPVTCPPGVKPGAIMGRMQSSVDAQQLRIDLGCNDRIVLLGTFRVSAEGVPKQKGQLTASCGGLDRMIGASVNLKNITLGAPGGECGCNLKVEAPIAKEGSSG